MKRPYKALISFLIILLMPAGWAQTSTPPPEQTSTPPPETTLEETYHFVVFYPGYRFVSTSGFPGRVAEYDSLNQSIGGDLPWKQAMGDVRLCPLSEATLWRTFKRTYMRTLDS